MGDEEKKRLGLSDPIGDILDPSVQEALREAQKTIDESNEAPVGDVEVEVETPAPIEVPAMKVQKVDALGRAIPEVEPAPEVQEIDFTPVKNALNEEKQALNDYIGKEETRLKEEEDESISDERDYRRAARWTGLGEVASSIANLIGVGAGNAVSQQYRFVSQDWMKKADAERESRKKRMAELKSKLNREKVSLASKGAEVSMKLAELQMKADAQKLINATKQAEIEYRRNYNNLLAAKTATEIQRARLALKESEEKIKALQALAKQRNASAYSSRKKADAAVSKSENENANRDVITAAKVATEEAKQVKERAHAGYYDRAPIKSGITIPAEGRGVVTPEGGSNATQGANPTTRQGKSSEDLIKDI